MFAGLKELLHPSLLTINWDYKLKFLLKNKNQHSWRSNWHYWAIQELGSIQSSNQKCTLKSCTKWKGFIERRVGKGAISKTKQKIYIYTISSFEGEGMERVLIIQISSSFYADGEGPWDRFLHWCWPENSKVFDLDYISDRGWNSN